ncbi:MAG: putative teichuronic acid biosynthesis glycosyltransferase TuaC [Betaproteobacteria bacterium ADurb.Bin341]|nr:MAG: putative teichuronic acid biosynthesis glycosyltransferase TuaC [Betaproteobacteria bacterium ADurb.Bin341]
MTAGNSPLRVAIATGGVFPEAVGGSQRHTRLLVEHLSKNHDVELHVLHPHAKRLFEGMESVREITIPRFNSRIQYLFDCYGYSRRVRDVISTLPPETIIYGQCTAVWSGISRFRDRFVLNPHGLEPYQTLDRKTRLKYTPMRWAHDWLFNQSRHIISLGGRLTDIIRDSAHPSAKIHVIPNAVDLPASPPCKQFGPVCRLAFVGRHFSNKGIRDLVEAMRLLADTPYRDRVRLDLVGDGPLLPELRTAYTSPNVTFHGRQGDDFLNRILAEADLFVFPTLFEGMPTVVMEAMSYGTPIAVTDTGATLDLLDEQVGFLLQKKNPGQIAETIKRFVDLPAESKRAMGDAARAKIARQFTWPVVARQHYELFRNLAEDLRTIQR